MYVYVYIIYVNVLYVCTCTHVCAYTHACTHVCACNTLQITYSLSISILNLYQDLFIDVAKSLDKPIS